MSVHITTTSPVIIDDVGDEDLISHLRGCLGANGSPLVCVDASALALELDCIIEEELASPFVIISPGRGGEDARSRSRVAMKASHLIIAPARRLWSPGNNPVVLAWPLETAQLLFLEVRTVLVLDDVVSSGANHAAPLRTQRMALSSSALDWGLLDPPTPHEADQGLRRPLVRPHRREIGELLCPDKLSVYPDSTSGDCS